MELVNENKSGIASGDMMFIPSFLETSKLIGKLEVHCPVDRWYMNMVV
jgi:hypothetical protein